MVDYSPNQLIELILNKKENALIEGPELDQDISYQWIKKNNDLQIIEEGIPIVQFSKKIKSRNLEMEFKLIRRLTESQYHNTKLRDYHPNMNQFNRYSNILPYTHSEVKLQNNNQDYNQEESQDDFSYYINANFINSCFNDKKYFIATQGPLKNTIQNFWNMVCQQKVNLIVMLCNLKEQSRIQCDQYWPNQDDKMLYVDEQSNLEINVQMLYEKQDLNKLIQREFLLIVKQGNDIKEHGVKQIQWTGWPDHGVPEDNDQLTIEIILQEMFNHYINKNDSKILVHQALGSEGVALLFLFSIQF